MSVRLCEANAGLCSLREALTCKEQEAWKGGKGKWDVVLVLCGDEREGNEEQEKQPRG